MKDPGEFLNQISKFDPSKEIVDALILLVREAYQEITLLNQQLVLLKQEIVQLKDEIAILKNQPPRPKIKPSSLEKNNKLNVVGNKKKSWSKSSKNSNLTIDQEVTIELPNNQKIPGLAFKGYKKIIVQELIIKKKQHQSSSVCHV